MRTDLCYHSLLDEYEETKKILGETENTLRRITGRRADNFVNPGVQSKFGQNFVAKEPAKGNYGGKKRPFPFADRKEAKESSNEEDSLEDEDNESPQKKHTLQSTVVASKGQSKSRKAIIEDQNVNSKIKARNRRMFGALIGTLAKFQHEEKGRQQQEVKRAVIEQKIEAATEEERERIKKEKELLFETRREKKTKLRCLEKKIERAESYDVYDANLQRLTKFIRTKANPQIFFLPAHHTPKSMQALERSKAEIQDLIQERKECFEKDLLEIEEWYKNEQVSEEAKEEECPKEEGESQDKILPESESESNMVEPEYPCLNDDSNPAKTVESVADQDFEPIYD